MSGPTSTAWPSSCTRCSLARCRAGGRRKMPCAAAAYSPPGALPPNRTNNWVAGPTELLFERIVEGELPESEYATLVEEIRRAIRNPGHVSQFGRSFSWMVARGPAIRRDLEIAVSVSRGHTRITIQESLNQLIREVFGGVGVGMGCGGMGPIIVLCVGRVHLAVTALVGIIRTS